MKHGRLSWLTSDEMTPEQRALFEEIAGGPRAHGRQAFPLTDEAGRLHGPFNALLLSPEVGTAVQALGSAIRYRSSLSARAREIAILELSVRRRCEFEWYAHVRVGRAAGLTGDELRALQTGAPAPTFDERETLVRELVGVLLDTRDLDDAAYARAAALLGERTLMDAIALVGYYDLLALSLRVWRTPLPESAEPAFG